MLAVAKILPFPVTSYKLRVTWYLQWGNRVENLFAQQVQKNFVLISGTV